MRPTSRQDGVTLVELLVAITLIGLVVPALTGAFIVGFRTFADTGDRVSESSAAEIATAYWGPDVMNATGVSLGTSADCGVAGDPVVAFTTPTVTITWFVSGSRLVREECGGTDTTITGVLSTTLAPVASCAPVDCSGTVELLLPQAGSGGVGDFITELSATRRNVDA